MEDDDQTDSLAIYYEEDPSWRQGAVCVQVDPELWFPDRGGTAVQAKALCRTCPVRQECLEYALKAKVTFGIWGGYGYRDRLKIIEARSTAA